VVVVVVVAVVAVAAYGGVDAVALCGRGGGAGVGNVRRVCCSARAGALLCRGGARARLTHGRATGPTPALSRQRLAAAVPW
jgi:hypothetical protein